MPTSEFGLLLEELDAAARRQTQAARRATPASSSVPLPRVRPDVHFAKSLDGQLTQMEGRSQVQGAQMDEDARVARLEDIRRRARQAIAQAMAQLHRLIAAGEISTVEVAQRQILLDAFAQRMGL